MTGEPISRKMEQFLIAENIHRFRHHLRQESLSPDQRKTLERLLMSEKAKLEGLKRLGRRQPEAESALGRQDR